MPEYEVMITPEAENDLNELDDYITFELMAPSTALAYIKEIRIKIASLAKAPMRYRPIDDEPWHSRHVRRMNAKGFAVHYIVIEQEATVFVQNVIYQKRDIPRVLASLYPDLGEI